MKKLYTLLILAVLISGYLYAGGGQPSISKVDLKLELIADGLTAPLALVGAGDNSGRLFVADQVGTIHIIDSNGDMLAEPFLDISDKLIDLDEGFDERGLLGLAFHPDYANNGRFFIFYSGLAKDTAYDHTNYVAEYSVSDDENLADENSEKILLEWQHPQFNHNAGTLEFGPDGYLYISIGDGGGADDNQFGHVEDWYDGNVGGNGQDITQNLLGNILRIDINNGDPYGIPSDNPFVDKDGLDEIYAYGLRNPYRFSIDKGGDNDLIAGDAGQNLYEEVSLIIKGGNYGWNIKEGAHCFDAENPNNPPADCPDVDNLGNPLIDPVIEFANSSSDPIKGLGNTVIGGYVYRGTEIEELMGKYLFGVFSRSGETADGRVFAATPKDSGTWNYYELELTKNCSLGEYLRSFGQDDDNEIYLLASEMLGPEGNTGKIYKLAPNGNSGFPTGVDDKGVPLTFKLHSVYPNPFNPSTVIKYSIPEDGNVNITVYDIMGKEVAVAFNEHQIAGTHELRFDAGNLASGMYVFKLRNGVNVTSGKMLLMK